MYNVWIPILNIKRNEKQKEALLKELKRAKPDRVMLVFKRIICNKEKLNEKANVYKDNLDFLVENGFEVGAWIAPSIGYGSVNPADNSAAEEFRHIRKLRADEDVEGAYCPWDERFVDEFINTITTVVKLGIKVILFEDDFTLMGGKFVRDLGCACDFHIEEYCKRIGEKLTRKEISDRIFNGGRSKYRDAWIEMQRDTLLGIAQKIEKAVHTIDPNVRLGFSANGSSYDVEGIPLYELEKALAGNTRGFMRLTGAPYWRHAMTLAANIESHRVQTAWCPNDIDLMSEGDTYPRPRFWVSSAYLEIFDMITRADGGSNSILKYMIDYDSDANYETGYVTRHLLNQPVYEEIERRFSNKNVVGINHFLKEMSFKDRVFDEDLSIEDFPRDAYLPYGSQRFLADCSVPIVYNTQEGPYFAVDEHTRYLSEKQLKQGVITDIIGAKRLMERGIDVGIESLERISSPRAEYFNQFEDGSLVFCPEGAVFYSVKTKEGAMVDSNFFMSNNNGFAGDDTADIINSDLKIPACYRYENADGMKFMVYTFGIESVNSNSEWRPSIVRNYYRQKQLIENYKWFGTLLPAVSIGNPDLYILCKKDENSMAVGLWNIFPDSILEPVIELDAEYKKIDFYNCSGSLEKNRVILDKEISPYSYAFFTVYK